MGPQVSQLGGLWSRGFGESKIEVRKLIRWLSAWKYHGALDFCLLFLLAFCFLFCHLSQPGMVDV